VRSTREWRVRAEDDPWFAAAAHPGKEARAWQADDFYALGRSNWEDFELRWRQYAPDLGGTVLEIGCGPGRVTKALVETFDRVVALDVSPLMVQLARQVAQAEYHVVEDARIPVADRSVDAVFTCHVLQHFELKEYVRKSLNESRRVLREGGTIMAQMTSVSDPAWRRSRPPSDCACTVAEATRWSGGITLMRYGPCLKTPDSRMSRCGSFAFGRMAVLMCFGWAVGDRWQVGRRPSSPRRQSSMGDGPVAQGLP
jgi:SAM-dependent methyltransferase